MSTLVLMVVILVLVILWSWWGGDLGGGDLGGVDLGGDDPGGMILEEYDPGGDDVNIILSWRNMIALLMLMLIYFCSKVGDFEVRVEQAKLSQLTVKIFS